jgi:hypothetical protein
MSEATQLPHFPTTLPCFEHGAQIAGLGATLKAQIDLGNERHIEVRQKLDLILGEVTEANHRVLSLENSRAAQEQMLVSFQQAAATVRNLQVDQAREQGNTRGSRRVAGLWWALAASVAAGIGTGIVILVATKALGI